MSGFSSRLVLFVFVHYYVMHKNNVQLPPEEVTYIGLHLNSRLTWHKHIFAKQKQLGITLGRKSKLSTSNKLFIYKTILKPIWTQGIQLWGTASTSNIEILECFQSKALRMIVDAPWYVPNTVIQLKKKSAATALNTVLTSQHIQMT
jgi:hypothetical protein